MLIDWFTVAAQIINFFVLIFLLKLFLYGPLVGAMQKRKARVAEEMELARTARREADELNKSLQEKHREIESKAAEVKAEIHAESEQWRQQAMASAQQEIELQREEWFSALSREKQGLAFNLQKRVLTEVTAASSRIILDLTDVNLEERVIAVFLLTIEREASEVDCRGSDVVVRTGFVHEGKHRENTDVILNKIFPGCSNIVYVVDSEIGIGVELIAGDRKWDWNLSSYIVGLEKSIFDEIITESDGGL